MKAAIRNEARRSRSVIFSGTPKAPLRRLSLHHLPQTAHDDVPEILVRGRCYNYDIAPPIAACFRVPKRCPRLQHKHWQRMFRGWTRWRRRQQSWEQQLRPHQQQPRWGPIHFVTLRKKLQLLTCFQMLLEELLGHRWSSFSAYV